MNEDSNVVPLRQPDEIDDPLTNILRSGARQLLAQAVEMEAEAFLAAMKGLKLPDGRDRLVRHGHGPVRTIQTGIGAVEVARVKIRDRATASDGERLRFTSAILPLWARRTKNLDALLPALYLRGISTGDFQEALAALLGKDAPNLSPAVISRLTAEWQGEYERWQKRALRLPRRALGPFADDESHRKRVRDGPAQDGAHERLVVVKNCQVDGVQTALRRIEDLAAPERHKSVAEGQRRCQIRRWHRGYRSAGTPRRLIASSPKIPHSSKQGGSFSHEGTRPWPGARKPSAPPLVTLGSGAPRNLKYRMPISSEKLTTLATMITRSLCREPYKTQRAIPAERIVSIRKDKSPAVPVSQHFLSCG